MKRINKYVVISFKFLSFKYIILIHFKKKLKIKIKINFDFNRFLYIYSIIQILLIYCLTKDQLEVLF